LEKGKRTQKERIPQKKEVLLEKKRNAQVYVLIEESSRIERNARRKRSCTKGPGKDHKVRKGGGHLKRKKSRAALSYPADRGRKDRGFIRKGTGR